MSFKYKNIECILPLTDYELYKIKNMNGGSKFLIEKFLFLNSLITNRYSIYDEKEENYIISYVPDELIKEKQNTENLSLFNDLPQETLNEIHSIIKQSILGWAKINKKEVNLITFIRLKPTNCDICKRIHHSDNPFIIVTFTNIISINLHCRRDSENRSTTIGTINIDDDLQKKILKAKRKYISKVFEPENLDYVILNQYKSQYIRKHDLNRRFSLISSAINTVKHMKQFNVSNKIQIYLYYLL
jgi:hypothetical protein